MSYSCDLDFSLRDFSGAAPIFPLPNVVLFPNALVPLQIFESRYRQMTADALEGERLIAMGLLESGWEKLPSKVVPPVHQMVGLGKIIAHEKLDDGRYYLVLRGLARAKILSENRVDLPYRVGQLQLCADEVPAESLFDRQERAHELTALFSRLFPQVELQKLFMPSIAEMPLATICDVLLGAIPLPPEVSQQYLNQLDVDVRSQMLLELLEQAVRLDSQSRSRTFPPVFSAN